MDYAFQAMDYALQAMDYALQAVEYAFRAVEYLVPAIVTRDLQFLRHTNWRPPGGGFFQ